MSQGHDDILDSVFLITGSEARKFGTGFAFRQEGRDAWILTCAHVVRDVGGPDDVRINDERMENEPATVVGCGDGQQADLAVLKVRVRPSRHIPTLRLGLVWREGLPCQVAGFADLSDGIRRAVPLDVVVRNRVLLQKSGGPRIRAWKLWLDHDSPIEEGYSGSPVACARTMTVFAVASHSEDKGQRGYAVSLENLSAIWPELPPDWIGPELAAEDAAVRDARGPLEALFSDPPIEIGELRALCLAAMPRDAPHRLPADATPLDLLEWLRERSPLSNGRVPLLDVLDALLPKVVDADRRMALAGARATIAAQFKVQDTPAQDLSRAADRDVQPALVVEMWPVGPSGARCNVQARLFQSAGLGQGVYVREGDQALRLDDRVQLAGLVADLRGIVVERDVSEERVVIEFALPRELLSHAMDQWTDPVGDPLGVYLPVVVRPRERLRDPRLQLGWHGSWEALRARFATPLPDLIWWLLDEGARRQIRGKLETGACIALGFVPDPLADERTNILLYLTYAGAPVALWPRQEQGIADLRGDLGCLLQGRRLGSLPQALRDLRRQLWEAGRESAPCYHLTLLWDDPGRRLANKPRQDEDFYQAPL